VLGQHISPLRLEGLVSKWWKTLGPCRAVQAEEQKKQERNAWTNNCMTPGDVPTTLLVLILTTNQSQSLTHGQVSPRHLGPEDDVPVQPRHHSQASCLIVMPKNLPIHHHTIPPPPSSHYTCPPIVASSLIRPCTQNKHRVEPPTRLGSHAGALRFTGRGAC
jgi:hypothetical protein